MEPLSLLMDVSVCVLANSETPEKLLPLKYLMVLISVPGNLQSLYLAFLDYF